ncbi:MAG TPA: SIS domain-containing protein, partial [Spirochaetota bacterium]|nr:SIS domain-containing protein [Spirochaetota bacterium]
MNKHLQSLLTAYPGLKAASASVSSAAAILVKTFKAGNKLLLCGNGGSAADCEHIAGELLKGFNSRRTLTAG